MKYSNEFKYDECAMCNNYVKPAKCKDCSMRVDYAKGRRNPSNYDPFIPGVLPKDSQTAKKDAGKPKLTLVPLQILYDIAEVREYGNSKYGSSENWKDVDPQRYRDALFRHLVLYLKDPDGVDEESGLPHLSHIACNVAFLCQMHEDFKNVDEPYEDPKRDPSGCPLYSEEDGKCRGLGFECEYAYDYDCESVLKAYTAGAFDFLVDSVVKGGN